MQRANFDTVTIADGSSIEVFIQRNFEWCLLTTSFCFTQIAANQLAAVLVNISSLDLMRVNFIINCCRMYLALSMRNIVGCSRYFRL